MSLGDDARGLGSALNPQRVERAADSLIDGMRGNTEFDGNLFRGQMLVDEKQGVELALAQPADAIDGVR